ncbi:MAG: cupin domain-containing protein [Pseudomonadales bacterium]
MASVSYNPEFDPTGIEGGVDTNLIPWLELACAPGLSFKPLRASSESGMFSTIVRMSAGAELTGLIYLGAMDMILLSGGLTYPEGPLSSDLEPGTWGYIPANARIERLVANQDTEFLANFYGPVAFLGEDGRTVSSILTALDIVQAARDAGVNLVPNTLAECMQPRPRAYQGPAEPLAIAGTDSKALVTQAEAVGADAARTAHPHFVDTRALPWIENPEVPDMGLKVLRVSEETGVTSLIVRHNGVAGPHYHLAAADFLVLSGRIGYRAGPPEGYGPGVWFYEPAGARHEATQRVSDEDLIYTANVYGPLQFDEGRGTPIVAVQSWMQYKEMADAAGTPLVSNTFADDASLLAWAPVGSAVA